MGEKYSVSIVLITMVSIHVLLSPNSSPLYHSPQHLSTCKDKVTAVENAIEYDTLLPCVRLVFDLV